MSHQSTAVGAPLAGKPVVEKGRVSAPDVMLCISGSVLLSGFQLHSLLIADSTAIHMIYFFRVYAGRFCSFNLLNIKLYMLVNEALCIPVKQMPGKNRCFIHYYHR